VLVRFDGGQRRSIDDVEIRARGRFTLTIEIDFSFDATHLQQYPLVVQQTHDGQIVGAYTVQITAIKDLEDFFFGNPRSYELHVSTCPFWPYMNTTRLRPFERIADGVARGYNGCRFCLPEADTD
jgi:hypothetical protein